MIRTVTCLLLSLCCCFTASAQQSKIVGGTEVAEGTYPWMASIGFPSNGSSDIFQNQYCGGTLVSQDYVLTAAHCVTDIEGGEVIVVDPSSIEVVVGVTDLSNVPSTARRRNVTQIIVHPDYEASSQGDLFNDVALLLLDAPITDITPIPMATAPTMEGTSVKAIGWGDTTDSENTVAYPDKLRQVEMETVSLSRIQSEFGNGLTVQHLGAFATGKDTCQGDSGGPMFTEAPLSLVGITSFGFGCADDTAGVYADVGFFSGYITSVIGDQTLLGDVNLDGGVDFLDVAPFIAILSGGGLQAEADVDQSGDVDFLDIAPFIAILSGQ